MSLDARILYELLPAIHRLRDAEQGEPLKALITLIAEQVAILEEDLAQLYDDQFIETCADWVVPYIGELIGYRPLHGIATDVRSPRAEVANTIRHRRRKGTAAMLEQLAQEVTGWEARTVEYFQRLATTQYLNHIRRDNLATPDLRRWEPLDNLDTAFDSLSHTLDVRRIASGRGRYNSPNVGLFLWRIHSYPVTAAPAFRLDARRYLFSPLGSRLQLYSRPQPGQPTDPANVPMPLGRRFLDAYQPVHYGPGKSLSIAGIAPEQVTICNLADADEGAWAHMPGGDTVAIDPVLGRIAFGSDRAAVPRVSYHYGFSADLGGGEYERQSTLDLSLQPVVGVPSPHADVAGALAALGGHGAIEIADSGRYDETPAIALTGGQRLELRAANGARPVITLGGEFRISGEENCELCLNGLLICGGALRIVASSGARQLGRLRLQHCTLLPGINVNAAGEPAQPGVPSLIVETANTVVEIDHCIVGGLRIAEGAQVQIRNSIVDASAETAVAYAGLDDDAPGAPLSVEASTVIGKVRTTLLNRASNSIFLARLRQADSWAAPVWTERRQQGCVRFCFLPLASRVPRRYRCQPESAAQSGTAQPVLASRRYGDANYCQLSLRCHPLIRQGADDGAEMGAFHDLLQPQREADLRARLDEYVRFGLEAGLLFAS